VLWVCRIWESLREVAFRPYGRSHELKELREIVSELARTLCSERDARIEMVSRARAFGYKVC
jgi:hypothetical protein